MRPLSSDSILQIWEIGQNQHPLDRALTLLAFAYPEKSAQELASLSIGQRDAYLLTLRELTFGPKLNGFAECPQCNERLEFRLNVTDIRIIEPTQASVENLKLTVEEFELQFRLPNSWDLVELLRQNSNVTASRLIQRCLQKVTRDGVSIDYSKLPEQAITQLVAQIAAADPQAEVLLNLSCPACQHDWQALFDIVAFFWIELTVEAKRLLQEVHTLARFYGWREADILAMSSGRRQQYLSMVN